MTSRITLALSSITEIATRLSREPAAIAVCRVGLGHLAARRNWLVQGVGWIPHRVERDDDLLVVRAAPSALELSGLISRVARRYPSNGQGAILGFAFEERSIAITGMGICAGELIPMDRLVIVGPGLPEVRFQTVRDLHTPAALIDRENGKWSRTIGALGEQTWRRLTELSFAVVGCGRNGSLVATALSRLGATNISLVDPDELEPHSLAEGDFSTSGIPGKKTTAAKDFVMSLSHAEGLRVTGVAESVFALPALAAIKGADVLICCVDNAEARYAVAFLAKLYLKPVLDVGTGILNGDGRPMGADIRLVLPDRCLVCFGGIAGLNTVIGVPDAGWQAQRAGSLRSLGQIAVGFLMRMLEDFIAARLVSSTWTQLDFSPSGTPHLSNRNPAAPLTCVLCDLSGAGDSGLTSAGSIRAEVAG